MTNFPLTSFICSCAQHKLTLKFSLENKPLFKSWSCHLFNMENGSVCTAGKENFSIQANVRTSSSRKTCPALHTSKQNLSRRIKLWGKTCSSYTRASKAEQGTCQGKLGRVCGDFLRTFKLTYNSQIFGVDIIRNFFSKTFTI